MTIPYPLEYHDAPGTWWCPQCTIPGYAPGTLWTWT